MPPKPRRKSGNEEYRFKIGAYSPAKIPMQRLAEYMQQLALILGEPGQVHFRRLSRGSTMIVARIEREATPKVHLRLSQVKQGAGPEEARRAYAAANKLLKEDDAIGSLKGEAIVLQFPGRNEAQEEFSSVRQQGFVDGTIIGVRGKDQTVHITLLIEGAQVSGFFTTRTIAKQLVRKWDEPVRLLGRGKWHRDSDGVWNLLDFKVEGFEELEDVPLSAALEKLRAIPAEWDENAHDDLQAIRHGPRGKTNGGH